MRKTTIKRLLLVLTMLVCCLSFTACDSSSDQISNETVKASKKDRYISVYGDVLKQWASEMIQYLDAYDNETIKEDAEGYISVAERVNSTYASYYPRNNDKTVEFYNAWLNCSEDLGKLNSIGEVNLERSSETGKLCVITLNASYENNESVDFEFVIGFSEIEGFSLQGAAINPSTTLGEKGYKAAMNTLIGMGTVFIVLIFISFIIYLFKFINKFAEKSNKSDDKIEENNLVNESVNNTVSQIEKRELTADTELVAVIAAAIASYEGTTTDGFVVRSIRKVSRR